MWLIPQFIRRRIEHRPNLAKAVDNIGWLFADKVLRMGVGLFVGVLIARYLGPERFGLFCFAVAFTGLFGAIATMGLPEVVVRDIVRDPASAKKTLGTAGVLQLLGGVAGYLLVVGLILLIRPDDRQACIMVAILGAALIFKASDIAVYWFDSQVQSRYRVWAQHGVFLTLSCVKVILILQEATLIAFAWVVLAEAILVAIVLLFVMQMRGALLFSLQSSAHRAKSLLHDSWPLILSGLAVMVYLRIDQIMLGQMVGDESVGIYSAAVRLSEAWYFVPAAIVASVFPAIMEAKKTSEVLYNARFQKLYDLMVVVSVLVALPMTFLAGPLVVLLYGAEYADSGPVLTIHVWGAVFVFLGVASNKWFIAENKQFLSLQRTILGATTNIFLNFLLIPKYGAKGAAIATIFSQLMAAWLSDLLQPSTWRMFQMKLAAMNPIRLAVCYFNVPRKS